MTLRDGAHDDTALATGPAPPCVVSWGELLWDLFPEGPRLGGAAANLAYHSARLGDDAVLVSRVGKDELGARATTTLRQAGVDVGLVQIDPEKPTGTVRVNIVGGEPRFEIVARVAWDDIAWTPEIAERLAGAHVFCYSTLAQRTPLGKGALARALTELGPTVTRLCDLNLRAPFDDVAAIVDSVARAHVVKLNDAELERFERLLGVSNGAAWLLERGVKLVAVTRGSHGSLLLTHDATWASPGVPSDTSGGDPVGAGDAFAAVMAHHLARGSGLRSIGEHANRYASYVASRPGAMPDIPSELLRFSRDASDPATRGS
jgi:fructokinase